MLKVAMQEGICRPMYSRPSLVQIAWELALAQISEHFGKIIHFQWRDNLFIFNAQQNSYEYHYMGHRISEV